MNLIQLQNGFKAYGSRGLFKDATFAVNEGEHVGVIGPNGAGKTTLFKILNGQEELDDGIVVKSKALKMGYLEQEVQWAADLTLENYLSKCSLPIWELKALGIDLGLDEEKFTVPMVSLSGGYRMRCKLLYLIGCEPNLMMLDEPTNYLDLETLLVLEKFLQNFRQAFLLISHDREFLRRTTDHTLEIESQEVTKFPGNIDDYFEEKAMLREQVEKHASSVSAKRQEILDFAARFGAKATKARQVQSRLKSLKRLQEIEVRPLPVSATIRIPQPRRIGKRAITTKNLDLGYGSKTILSNVNLNLIRGDKIGLVGFNGVGKSTLLKGLAKVLEPQNGSTGYGMDVDVGYYAQHVAEELDLDATVLEQFEHSAHKDLYRQDILDLAGSLLFSGDSVTKKTSKLSGGEKARVALGKILLQKVPVLLLDEVTNHLDFNTVEALTQALNKYEGTLVMVSHDRGFIRRVATKIFEIRDGKVLEFHGSYDEYVWSLEKGALSKLEKDMPEIIEAAPEKPEKKSYAGGYKEERKFIERQIRQVEKKSKELEKKISTSQSRIEEINQELSKDQGVDRGKLLPEMSALAHKVMGLEETWLKLLEEKDRLGRQLEKLISS